MSLLARWWGRFTGRRPSRLTLLNDGLDLAMDWGESWLAPIQPRLHKKYPWLEVHELEELNHTCRAAMNFGHELVYELRERRGGHIGMEDFSPLLLARFSWVDPGNVSRLFGQSTYYAWKSLGPATSR